MTDLRHHKLKIRFVVALARAKIQETISVQPGKATELSRGSQKRASFNILVALLCRMPWGRPRGYSRICGVVYLVGPVDS